MSRRGLIIFANLRQHVNYVTYSSAHRKKLAYLTHAHLLIYCQALYAISICTIDDMEINVWRKEIWRQKGLFSTKHHTNDNYRYVTYRHDVVAV